MKLNRLPPVIFTFLWADLVLVLFGEVVVLSLLASHFNRQTLLWILLFDSLAHGLTAYLHERFRTQPNPDYPLNSTLIGSIGVLALVRVVGYSPLTLVLLLWVQHSLASTLYQHLIPHIGSLAATGHHRNWLIRLMIGGRVGATAVVLSLIPILAWFTETDIISIWLMAAILYLGLARLIPKITSNVDGLQETVAVSAGVGGFHRLLQGGLGRWLTLSTAGIGVLTTVIFYYTLSIVAQQGLQDFHSLLLFFALSSTVAVGLMLPLEYWIFKRLLHRLDAGRLAWVYPSMLNLAFIGVLVIPSVPIAAFGYISYSTLRYSLQLPLERLLYHALPVSEQQWLRRMISTVVEPLVVAGTVAILLVAFEQQYWVFGLGSVVGVGLLLVARQTGFLYGQALANSLRAGHYRLLRQTAGEWEAHEYSMIKPLLSQLQTRQVEASELLLIAEVVAKSAEEAAYQVLCEIWQESSASLQAELLPIIIHNWPDRCDSPSQQGLIFAALRSDYAELRLRALELIAIYPTLDTEYQSARFLIDPSARVNVIAATILLRHPSHDIQKAARAQLRWLAMGTHVSTRVAAISALVQGSLNRFGEVVVPLDVEQYLKDSATRVREAILPAAGIVELIEAACDPAEIVRNSAAQHLAQRRWQGALSQLVNALEAARPTAAIQIEGMMRYWRLLMALSTVQRRAAWQRLIPSLQQGFEYLLVLRTMVHSLGQLQQPALTPLLQQLTYDHHALFEMMRDTLSRLIGAARMQAIIWTLESDTASIDEQAQALRALQNLITPQLAENFRQILQNDSAPAQHSTLPHIALAMLLNQDDEWHPILTLYCMSQLPTIQRILWLPDETALGILKRGSQSHLDVIREAARLIKRVLNNENVSEGIPMLSTLERMVFLRNVSFFQYLRLDQLRSLARGCTELAAQPGEVIIQQGAVGDGLYIVVEGEVQIKRRIEQGDKVVDLGKLGPTEVFGEISLLDGEPRTADVVAETAVLLLSIQREALHLALEDDPNIAMTMLRILAQRLRRTTEQIDLHATA